VQEVVSLTCPSAVPRLCLQLGAYGAVLGNADSVKVLTIDKAFLGVAPR
jgi:hypothetical protein